MSQALDANTAAELRRQAEALAKSQGIALAEARQVVWRVYQDEQVARQRAAEPPASPPATPPPAETRDMRPRWNDTGTPPRAYHRTDEQFSRGKAELEKVRGLIKQGRTRF